MYIHIYIYIYDQHSTNCLVYTPHHRHFEANTHAVSVGGVRIYDAMCLGARHGRQFHHHGDLSIKNGDVIIKNGDLI